MNSISLMGRLASDVETREVGSDGVKVSEFRLAVRKNKDEAVFVDVKAWRGSSDIAEKYLKKGSFVGVTGRLDQENWKDKESGANRSKIVVVATDLSLGPKVEGDGEAVATGKAGGKSDDDDIF